jgi:hypothetical protein
MFGSRQRKINQEISEIRIWIVGQAVGFASDIAEQFESEEDTEPRYRRVVTSDTGLSPTTSINQMLLIVESAAFFMHALSRFAFRPNDETVRDKICNPVKDAWISVLDELFRKTYENSPITRSNIVDHLNMRETEYGSEPNLLGNSADDPNCGVSAASRAIAEAIGRSGNEHLFAKSKIALMKSLLAMDLKRRVDSLAELMAG